ncbi:hypothetical protein [Haloterrigena gelatinilytica]|nr:hypothetical protein [Haloterrigena gelatinilytica]
MSLETRDQEYMDGTELEAAIEYAEIADEYDVPVTLFVTGKAAKEEPERLQTLAEMDDVEIGGHNYWAFGTPFHKLFRGILGSWHGPRRFQAWEIEKTIKTFANLGVSVESWRDHAYRHDENTIELLSERGVTHFSDEVRPDGGIRNEDGLKAVPINTPPDHEHTYHAFRSPEFVENDAFEGPFGQESVEIGEWVDWSLRTARELTDKDMVVTFLVHPACMKLADDFDSFRRLCREIRDLGNLCNMTAV